MIATQLLMVDHEEAMTMLDTLVARSAVFGEMDTRDPTIFLRLRAALELHYEIEETLFYPTLKSFPETKELIEQSFADHAEVKQLLKEIEPGNSLWDDQIVTLRRQVQDHAEEEEHKLFPQAERLLGENELLRIGRQIQAHKGEQTAVA